MKNLLQNFQLAKAAFGGKGKKKGQNISDLSCWVGAGCTKSKFIKGLKMIESYVHAGKY